MGVLQPYLHDLFFSIVLLKAFQHYLTPISHSGLQSHRNFLGLPKWAGIEWVSQPPQRICNLLVNFSRLAVKFTFVNFRAVELGVTSTTLELILQGLVTSLGCWCVTESSSLWVRLHLTFQWRIDFTHQIKQKTPSTGIVYAHSKELNIAPYSRQTRGRTPRSHTGERQQEQAGRLSTSLGEKTALKTQKKSVNKSIGETRLVMTTLVLRPARDLQKRPSSAWTQAEEEPRPEKYKHCFLSHPFPGFLPNPHAQGINTLIIYIRRAGYICPWNAYAQYKLFFS